MADKLWIEMGRTHVPVEKGHHQIDVSRSVFMRCVRELTGRGLAAIVYGYLVPSRKAMALVAQWQRSYGATQHYHPWPTLMQLDAWSAAR